MDTAVYRDPSEEIRLSHDKDAIDWMLVNFKGLPVVAEAVTPIYRWGSRISIYTGFPTVIGWNWHQQQQRIFSHKEIQARFISLVLPDKISFPIIIIAALTLFDLLFIFKFILYFFYEI